MSAAPRLFFSVVNRYFLAAQETKTRQKHNYNNAFLYRNARKKARRAKEGQNPPLKEVQNSSS
jgi:hypothetical protein